VVGFVNFDCRTKETWKEAAKVETLFEFARVLLIEYRHFLMEYWGSFDGRKRGLFHAV